ncbi:MAG: hypothetical protein E7593_00640 [Ruminococcaceae bacterium]|nr:hypothetical protein [Oscillospiraceae bacterium]
MKKTLFITICLCLLLSVVSCKQKPQQVPDKQLYNDIISQYTELLTAKYNGEELPKLDTKGMDKREAEIAKTLHSIVSACKDKKSAYNMGYGYKDMDGNGTPELFLMTKYTTIKAIFTISDGKPILLEANYEPDGIIFFARKNHFYIMRSIENGSIEENTIYSCNVDGDKMEYISVYGAIYDREKKQTTETFQIVDGKRIIIDEETFDELYEEYGMATNPGYIYSKLSSPRIYLPLVNNDTDIDLPVADFSSYSAILKTYKTISTCVDDFSYLNWINGVYDNLFTFPNDLSFEYYNRLIYGAYGKDLFLGYDEIDLNGDGQDELVLLTENYNIKAIFTQKNGVPVLVDAFLRGACWLDEQGFIHVDRNDGTELEYSIYEFTKNGDYNLLYSLLITETKRYYTENGKTKPVTFEESLEYKDIFFCYPEILDPNEQTRNVSKLNYTPFTEITDDIVKAGFEETWYNGSDMEEATGKSGAKSSTYVTFENATDTQLGMNFKYVFSFYYPDPNKDNYYLVDKTESFLKITAHAEDGVFVFNESGIKGRLEFGNAYLWIIIEESTDERFPVGAHSFYKNFKNIIIT